MFGNSDSPLASGQSSGGTSAFGDKVILISALTCVPLAASVTIASCTACELSSAAENRSAVRFLHESKAGYHQYAVCARPLLHEQALTVDFKSPLQRLYGPKTPSAVVFTGKVTVICRT